MTTSIANTANGININSAKATIGISNSSKVTVGNDSSGCWGCGGYKREGNKINHWSCWGCGGYKREGDKINNWCCWGCGYKTTTKDSDKPITNKSLCCHPFGYHYSDNSNDVSDTYLTLGGILHYSNCKSREDKIKCTYCGPCFVKREEKNTTSGFFSSFVHVTFGLFNYWKWNEKLNPTSPVTEGKCISCVPSFYKCVDKDGSESIITTGLCNICSYKDKKTGSTHHHKSILPFYSRCGDEKNYTICCTTGLCTHSKGSNDGKPFETKCGSWGLGCSCYQKDGDKSGKCTVCSATPLFCMYCRSGRCCVQETECFSNFPTYTSPCGMIFYFPCLCFCCYSKKFFEKYKDECCCPCCECDSCCACLPTYKDIGTVDKSDIQSTIYSCVPCCDVERIPEIIEGVRTIDGNVYQEYSSATVLPMHSAIPMNQTMGNTPTTITYRTAVRSALLQTEDFAEFRRVMSASK
jgi:hypothetical protein